MGEEHFLNNTDREKSNHSETWPSAIHPPQIPYGLAYKGTQVSVVRGPGLRVRAICLRWEK